MVSVADDDPVQGMGLNALDATLRRRTFADLLKAEQCLLVMGTFRVHDGNDVMSADNIGQQDEKR